MLVRTVARYGHPADLFSLHVRTSTVSTFARRTPRAHVELDVRTSTSTFARRVLRAHVELDVRTSNSTCARRTRRTNVDTVDVRTWSEK